jgi:alcohol dehydrogenase
VDAAIELAGSVKAFENAFAMTRRGGISATGGLPHPDSRVSLPAVMMVAEERQVRGSYMGSCVPSRDIPHYIELYRSGRLPVQSLMSSTGPLDTINEHFDLLHRGDVVRHVIDMLNG